MTSETPNVVNTPEIPELSKVKDGKVRSIFNFAPGRLLMVASDRISARDRVLAPGIPGKGVVLNTVSTHFFQCTRSLAPNHYIADDKLPPAQKRKLAGLYAAYPWLRGRSMVVRFGWVVPIEFIFRVHITGSFFKEYKKASGPEQVENVLGYQLPSGMKDGDRLPEPIFTPSTKAPAGEHDVNITYDEALTYILANSDLDETKARRVLNWGSARGLEITRWAAKHIRTRGLILADHKIEVVLLEDGTELIADELLTPDSSRYFDLKEFEAGRLINVDKEPVREYLDKFYNGRGTPPRLLRKVVEETAQRYKRVQEALVS